MTHSLAIWLSSYVVYPKQAILGTTHYIAAPQGVLKHCQDKLVCYLYLIPCSPPRPVSPPPHLHLPYLPTPLKKRKETISKSTLMRKIMLATGRAPALVQSKKADLVFCVTKNLWVLTFFLIISLFSRTH